MRKQSNIIRDDVVPWGGAYCEPDKCNYGSNNNKILEYPYNGLECTGFVTWAFRNGYLGLGDWNTNLFAKDGRCRKGGEAHEDGIDDKEVERNYKCKDIVNYDNGDYHDTSNRNNRLLLAYPKLNLLQDKDFVEITNKNEADLNDIFMDAKAGDLLLRHNTPTAADIKKHPNIDYKYGHIAMIIGLKRDSNQKVTSIYVGEAMPWSGNRLTTFKSMNDFSNSTDWVKLNKNSYKISFLVKMENVYNYYSEIKRVKKESANSDCPGKDKSSGNCYAYTENYNDEFNKALKMFELEDKK